MSFFRKKPVVVAPVHREDLAAFLQRAVPVVEREQRREKRFGNAKTAAILGLSGFLAWNLYRNDALSAAVIEASNRVIYAVGRDDGTLTNSEVYRSLPAKFQTDNTLNTLWSYVFWQECYSESSKVTANHHVQEMSDEGVANEWRAFFGRKNENSPQNTLGGRGAYHHCEPGPYTPLGDDGYLFRFTRFEVDNRGNRGRPVNMFASVKFRTGVYPDRPDGWIPRVTYNAPGVQVWEYIRGRPESPRTPMISAAQPRSAAQGGPPR